MRTRVKTSLRKSSPFLFSLLIHLSAFSLMAFTMFGGSGEGDRNSGSSEATDSRDIIDKIDVEMVEHEQRPPPEEDVVSEVPLITEVQPAQDYIPDCIGENYFGGIGLMYDPETKVVSKTFSSYPASKAGIGPGDTILKAESRDGSFIQGPIGTIVKVTVRKFLTYEIKEYTITRGKICTLGEKIKGAIK